MSKFRHRKSTPPSLWQLMLPLYNEIPEGYFAKHPLFDRVFDALPENQDEWTDGQSFDFAEAFLHKSLWVLASDAYEDQKVNVLCWVFTDIDLRDIDYSFNYCCRALGYDPDELRELIEYRLCDLKPSRARTWLKQAVEKIRRARSSLRGMGAMQIC